MVFKIYRAMALLIKVFESQLLTETFRGSAQARPKQALHVTSRTACFSNSRRGAATIRARAVTTCISFITSTSRGTATN